jgi:hypothetical protein
VRKKRASALTQLVGHCKQKGKKKKEKRKKEKKKKRNEESLVRRNETSW